MRFNWKSPRLAMLVFLPLACAGCAGISAGTTVSPAMFLLPGLIKADPPASVPAPVAVTAPPAQLAQAW